jgi:long-chain fatty acid transport protein
MKQKFARTILNGAIAALALGLWVTPGSATEGYFQEGYGARQKALAGAGVADGRDATAASLNPAGIVHADNELDVAATIFSPRREMVGSGPPGFTPTGEVESDLNWFLIPNIARNWRLEGNPWFDAVAVAMYGNGGMNTTYPAIARPLPECGGGTGIFCGGKAGVDLQQMFVSVAGAKRFGSVSVGVAPIFALQMFKATGLGAFAAGGASSDPGNLTNRDRDISIGGGVRAGIEWAILPHVRLGLAGTTPIWMQKFDKYSGLFAEQGGFDIPASMQAGIAVDVMPAVTVMADYRRIWYSSVASVGNPSTNLLLGPSGLLGLDDGAGFGWKDVDVFKVGAEWRASPKLTLRAGYAYNTQPIDSRDVMINILAPGVVQHHITGGLQYRLSRNVDLELAGMYALDAQVTGSELPIGPPADPNHQIEISMHQYEVTLGIKYRFGGDEGPLK